MTPVTGRHTVNIEIAGEDQSVKMSPQRVNNAMTMATLILENDFT